MGRSDQHCVSPLGDLFGPADWLGHGEAETAGGRQSAAERRLTSLWVALTGITLFYFLENLALRYTSVINAGVLANLTAVFLALLGTLWLHERLTRIEGAAIGVAFLGAALVSQGSGTSV